METNCNHCVHLLEGNLCKEMFNGRVVVIGNPAEFSCVEFTEVHKCNCRICKLRYEHDGDE